MTDRKEAILPPLKLSCESTRSTLFQWMCKVKAWVERTWTRQNSGWSLVPNWGRCLKQEDEEYASTSCKRLERFSKACSLQVDRCQVKSVGGKSASRGWAPLQRTQGPRIIRSEVQASARLCWISPLPYIHPMNISFSADPGFERRKCTSSECC